MPPVRMTDTVHFTFLKIHRSLTRSIRLYRTFDYDFRFWHIRKNFCAKFHSETPRTGWKPPLVRHNSFNILNDSCQISVLHKEKLQWKRRNGFFLEIDVFVSTFMSHNCHRHHNRSFPQIAESRLAEI